MEWIVSDQVLARRSEKQGGTTGIILVPALDENFLFKLEDECLNLYQQS